MGPKDEEYKEAKRRVEKLELTPKEAVERYGVKLTTAQSWRARALRKIKKQKPGT